MLSLLFVVWCGYSPNAFDGRNNQTDDCRSDNQWLLLPRFQVAHARTSNNANQFASLAFLAAA